PVPLCGSAEQSVQLPGNDPFEIAILEESDARVRAIVALRSSPEVFYVTLDDDETPAARMRIAGGPSFSLEGYAGALGEALGVGGMALRPAQGGAPTTAFLTVRRTSRAFAGQAVDLVWFDATRGAPTRLDTLRLTDLTGA